MAPSRASRAGEQAMSETLSKVQWSWLADRFSNLPLPKSSDEGKYTRAQVKGFVQSGLENPVIDPARHKDIAARFAPDFLRFDNLRAGVFNQLGGDPEARPPLLTEAYETLRDSHTALAQQVATAVAEAEARLTAEHDHITKALADLAPPNGADPGEIASLAGLAGAVTDALGANPDETALTAAAARLPAVQDEHSRIAAAIQARFLLSEQARLLQELNVVPKPTGFSEKDIATLTEKRKTALAAINAAPITEKTIETASNALADFTGTIGSIKKAKSVAEGKALWADEIKRLLAAIPLAMAEGSQRDGVAPLFPAKGGLEKELRKLFNSVTGLYGSNAWDPAFIAPDIAANADAREDAWLRFICAAAAAKYGKGEDAVKPGAKPQLTKATFWKFLGWNIKGLEWTLRQKGTGGTAERAKLHITVSGNSIVAPETAVKANATILEGTPAEIYSAFFEAVPIDSRVHITRDPTPTDLKKHLFIGNTNGLGMAMADTDWGGDAKIMKDLLAGFRKEVLVSIGLAKAKGWKL